MNQLFLAGTPTGLFHSIHYPGFAISWAGASPFGEGFCLGSETGQLALTDTKGNVTSLLGQASASGESINGVAFSSNRLAVTTRKDINLIGAQIDIKMRPKSVVISGGALDVIATPSGHFVVPLGRAGVIYLKPDLKEDDPITIVRSDNVVFNYCRAIPVESQNDTDLVVFAGRQGGVGFAELKETTPHHILHTVKFNELEIVEVCSIATNQYPLAVAAAGVDGTLVLFRDIKSDKSPLTFKLNAVTGCVYRLLSAGGDIYLLTSEGLFGLFQFADKFLQGASLTQITTEVFRFPIEAADANIVDQKWLLAVGADDLFKFDLEKMPVVLGEAPQETGRTNGGVSWATPSVPEKLEIEPHWDESEFEQTLENLAAVS